MIKAKLLDEQGILVVSPVDRLQPVDFERIRLLADPYIEKHGKLNGLLIDAEAFPGWADFAAMLSHLRFINNHQEMIKRVAAITDSRILSILPKLGDHFLKADIRHFDYRDRDKAMEWLRSGKL